jgi:hypothetical protein
VLTAAQCFAVNNPSKPLVIFSGANSHVRKPLYSKITSQQEWDKIWVAHLGTSPDDAFRAAFEIDFEKCLVVVIFRGDQINVRGIEVVSLREQPDITVLRFAKVTYQTANERNNKPPDKPFAFVVLPKNSKQIILEEGMRTMTNEPLKWKEVIRLR